jgi:AcrR family transcriptional regulator
MSIEEVAARAGVGKATIYRRWPSKGLLALDAFVTSFREQQPLPDTGTLRDDLIAALTEWIRAVTQTSMGPMLTGLIAEAQYDPGLRAAWRDRVLEPLRSQRRIMLDRAIARGEIPATVDREVVLDLFFGAAQHRLLLGHLPLSDDFIREVVDVILDGIRAHLGLEPAEEGHHLVRDDADGTVVGDGHVLEADALGGRDRCGRLPQVVAAAAGDVAGQPLLDGVQRERQAHDFEL